MKKTWPFPQGVYDSHGKADLVQRKLKYMKYPLRGIDKISVKLEYGKFSQKLEAGF